MLRASRVTQTETLIQKCITPFRMKIAGNRITVQNVMSIKRFVSMKSMFTPWNVVRQATGHP